MVLKHWPENESLKEKATIPAMQSGGGVDAGHKDDVSDFYHLVTVWKATRAERTPMKKTRDVKRKSATAESIARMADRGKDVSRFFTKSGRMVSPVQRVKVDFTALQSVFAHWKMKQG